MHSHSDADSAVLRALPVSPICTLFSFARGVSEDRGLPALGANRNVRNAHRPPAQQPVIAAPHVGISSDDDVAPFVVPASARVRSAARAGLSGLRQVLPSPLSTSMALTRAQVAHRMPAVSPLTKVTLSGVDAHARRKPHMSPGPTPQINPFIFELTVIDLKGRGLTAGDARAIASALIGNTTVSKVYLGANFLHGAGVRYIASAIASSAVTVLDVTNNSCGDDGALALADACCCASKLKSVAAGCNFISHIGASAFASSLLDNRCCSLEALHLYGNTTIGDNGVRGLCEALCRNTSLTLLDLHNTGISDFGALLLGSMLLDNGTLQTVYVSGNNIGPYGATAVADGIRGNSSLARLHVGGNAIGDAGAAFADALCVSRQLLHLDLSECSIGVGGLRRVVDAVRTNVIIQSVVFADADLLNTPAEMAQLSAALSSRHRIPLVALVLSVRALIQGNRAKPVNQCSMDCATWLAVRAPFWVLISVVGMM